MTIVESLLDQKRIPVYMRDKVNPLSETIIFTTEGEGEVFLSDIFTTIKEKEEGKNVSIDLTKAEPDELRAYMAELVPNFDRQRVYPNDIKKLLKWYDLLITKGITDFSKKEEETGDEEVKDETEPSSSTSTKRKDMSISTVKSTKTLKPKPMNAIPKKSIVGSKRGS